MKRMSLSLVLGECTHQQGHQGEIGLHCTFRELCSTIGVTMSQHAIVNLLHTLCGVLVIYFCKLGDSQV